MNPVKWSNVPVDFEEIIWHGNGENISNVDGVIHRGKGATIIKLELSEEDRRQLIEGNPVYLSMWGRVVPFMVSVNLGEITETIRAS